MAKSKSKSKIDELVSPVTEKSESADTVNPAENGINLQANYYFPSIVYSMVRTDFLDTARKVCTDYINRAKKQQKLNDIYPIYQTDNMFADPRLADLSQFVSQVSWDILRNQGYQMNNSSMQYMEMWCQEHHKSSGQEQHVHAYGSQIVGFYFIDCPENSSKVIFHDPKSAKVQINLPEAAVENATVASTMINFTPEPGMLIFTNSWLPHSVARHGNTKPLRFIHFNLAAVQSAGTTPPTMTIGSGASAGSSSDVEII
jgi:uncharacterized protein (TIGR02466 family)